MSECNNKESWQCLDGVTSTVAGVESDLVPRREVKGVMSGHPPPVSKSRDVYTVLREMS